MNLVSIIVPIYNVEQYLEKCIESILNQTYASIEIILVDDGSTDGSSQICDRYLQRTNVKVCHIANGGVGNARNFGIQKAVGDYITFVDADDTILPDHIENMVNLMVQNEAQLVICDFRKLTNTNDMPLQKCEECSSRLIRGKEALDEMSNKSSEIWGYVWNKLFRTKIIRENKLEFLTGIKIWEDMLFCAEYYIYCNKIVVNPRKTYLYLERDGSAVNNNDYSSVRTKYDAALQLNIFLEKHLIQKEIKDDSLFAQWVHKIVAETSIYDISMQFSSGKYIKERIEKCRKTAFSNRKYLSGKSRIKLYLYKICPRVAFCVLALKHHSL